jgi:APA family basic amino acid/polyamine antiporter
MNEPPTQNPPAGFRSVLSAYDAGALVAGSMVGSGIFIVSADIARQVGSPARLLLVWLVSGLMTVAGALAYGELAAMIPHAGGQYVYLREAYGKLWAFLFGWTLFLVIQTGTIAAVAVAFGRFAGVLFPMLGADNRAAAMHMGLSRERAVAIGVILFLTAANWQGVNYGRWVQNLFTSVKVAALAVIAIVTLGLFPNPHAVQANFGSLGNFLGGSGWSAGAIAAFGAAMVGGLFSADAWASVTFVAAEIRRPARDLPLALAGGTIVVIGLYLLVNLGYLAELPLHGGAGAPGVLANGIAHAQADRVAAAAMRVIWPAGGAILIAAVVMVSTFGCANGLILTGARVLYAMARDGVIWPAMGRLNRAQVPGAALLAQGIWACLLTISGSYGDLLDYVIFAQLLFYVLTVAAVFKLRKQRPDAPRPYRAWGYPWLPGAYIVAAVVLMGDLLVVKPRFTWPGLLIVLAGIPVYAWLNRRASTADSAADERPAATGLGA